MSLNDNSRLYKKKNFGVVPISAGEVNYLRHADAISRRKARLLQVRHQEREFAKRIREKYDKRRADVLKSTISKSKVCRVR